jgi:hypothetical protein
MITLEKGDPDPKYRAIYVPANVNQFGGHAVL